MLAGWAKRYDNTTKAEKFRKKLPLYPATLVGYGLGCLACEIFQTGQGRVLHHITSVDLTDLT